MEGQTTSATLITFTKKGITEWLESRGAGAILDTRAVARLLDRDVQSVRRYAKAGKLKRDMSICNRAIYRLDDVVSFILDNPRYVLASSPRFEMTDDVIELMRRIAYAHWRPLVDAVGIDDLLGDAQLRLMRQTIADESVIGAAIERTFAAIYRSRQRHVQTIPLDEAETTSDNTESTSTDSEDGDEDARAELAKLAMEIPIDEVRDIVRFYTGRK